MSASGIASVSAPLAAVLRAGRHEFNSAFALARQRFRDLDGNDVIAFARETIDPLARAVAAIDPSQVSDVVHAAYEIGIELVGHKLAGASVPVRAVEAAWERIALANVRHVITAPTRVLAAISNAVHQLRNTPGTDHAQWVEFLQCHGPECPDVDTLLRLGQLAGWRAGLAHYRAGALDVAEHLPHALVRAVLDLPADVAVPTALASLRRDPWFDPRGKERGLRLVCRYGAFRGFGGLFLTPPLVAAVGEDLLVASGDDCWLLYADRFGTTLHRAPRELFPERPAASVVQVRDGQVAEAGRSVDVSATGAITGCAVNSTTVVVATERTHALALLAR